MDANANWIVRFRKPLLLLIIFLGLMLRASGLFWGQAYSYFGQGDGIEAYSVAVDFGRGETRALYVGQPNYNDNSKLPGPLWTAFCFLGLRYGGSVYGVLAIIVALNTVLIYLVYLLTERTVGVTAGLWAAVFTAASPWPVYYSVGIYNPNVMAFLGVLLCLSLWQTIQHDHSRSIACVVLLLVASTQVHMSGLMMIPAAMLVLALSPVRLSIGWLSVGLVASFALYLPYVMGEMANGWQNTHGMLSGKGRHSWDCLKVFSVPPGLLLNWVPQWTRSMADYREMARACCGSYVFVVLLSLLSLVMTVLVILGVSWKVRSVAKGFLRSPRECFRNSPGILFLAIMVIVPLGLALASRKPFHTRYNLAILAPMFALAGAGAAVWLENGAAARKRRFRWLFLGSAIVTLCTNVWIIPSMYAYQGRKIDRAEAFLPSWRKLQQVYYALKAEAGPDHGVVVDDAAFIAEAPLGTAVARNAALIRRYVAVREKEDLIRSGQAKPVVRFRLCAAQQQAGVPAAYHGHGLALVRCPEP